jgi:hypothetical protein
MAKSEPEPWQLWFMGIGAVVGATICVIENKPQSFEGFAIYVLLGGLVGATLGYVASVAVILVPLILVIWLIYYAYREPWITGGIVALLIVIGIGWMLITKWRSESFDSTMEQEVDEPPFSPEHIEKMNRPHGENFVDTDQRPVVEARDEQSTETLLPERPPALGEQLRFYSCFISYSFEDDLFARTLNGRMEQAGLRVWFAPEDIQGGKKLHEQIDAAIRVHEKLLIVLSEASLKSEWVMTELRKAFKTERQSGKRKLFPVRLVDMKALKAWECFDADSGKDLAEEVRQYFIPDFSNWKDHDSFEAAFDRLLKDLRADANLT